MNDEPTFDGNDDLAKHTAELVERSQDLDETTFLHKQFDAGLAWVHHPVGEGGLGLSKSTQRVVNAVLEPAGRLYDWHRNPMGIGMCGPAIAVHGTPEQRDRHLRMIFTAEEIWCQLFSEPGAGSDVATLATRASRDGDEWVVDGQKVWTSWGSVANYGLLLARTDPDVPKHAGMTAFLLDMSSPGVEVRPLRQMTGEREFSEVYLTGVRIPDTRRLGPVGDGWKVAITTLMNERVSIGGNVEPRGSGPIESAVRGWLDCDAKNAVRRDELASLWVEAEVLRLLKLRAAHTSSSTDTPGPEGSLLKLGSARLEQRIRSFVVDLLGPAGVIAYPYDHPPRSRGDDHPVASFLWSPSNTIVGGTSDVMRGIIGERVLGLPAEPRADRDLPWRLIPKSG